MVLKKIKSEWVLLSRKTGRVLRRYGRSKPSEERVAKDERHIHFFAYVKPHKRTSKYGWRHNVSQSWRRR